MPYFGKVSVNPIFIANEAGNDRKRIIETETVRELLEIMLAQSREIDSLREELAEANRKLEDKRITDKGATGQFCGSFSDSVRQAHCITA